MLNLVALVGANSENSTNRKLLQYIAKHFASVSNIELLEIKDLPLFNKPAGKAVPEEVLKLAKKIEDADGVIIATPEYDHAIPACLQSALAWLSYGIYPLANKPVLITGASYGTLGSSRAQIQLRQILNSPDIRANAMPGSEFLLAHSLQAFDENNELYDSEVISKLEAVFDDFRLYIKIAGKLSNAKALLKNEAENFDWENL